MPKGREALLPRGRPGHRIAGVPAVSYGRAVWRGRHGSLLFAAESLPEQTTGTPTDTLKFSADNAAQAEAIIRRRSLSPYGLPQMDREKDFATLEDETGTVVADCTTAFPFSDGPRPERPKCTV